MGVSISAQWIRSQNRSRLGSASGIPLAEARDLAHACRNLKAKGIDPKARRAEERAAARRAAQKIPTFAAMSKLYLKAHSGSWRNPKHRAHRPWRPMRSPSSATCPSATLKPRTSISFSQRSSTKRQRLPRGYAVGSRIFSATPPPLDIGWGITRPDGRGTLNISCRRDLKFKKIRHHAALPYTDLGGFMAALRGHQSATALGLECLIPIAGRVSEVTKATWDEVDLDTRIWTIPASRMNGGREHRVPLSQRAVEILKHTKLNGLSNYLFPGGNNNKHLSENAFRVFILKSMGLWDATAHVFRSRFRDWCAERTNYPREAAEIVSSRRLIGALSSSPNALISWMNGHAIVICRPPRRSLSQYLLASHSHHRLP